MNYIQEYILKFVERLGEEKVRKVITSVDELWPYILLVGGIHVDKTPMETILNTAKEFMDDLDAKRREEKISKLMD